MVKKLKMEGGQGSLLTSNKSDAETDTAAGANTETGAEPAEIFGFDDRQIPNQALPTIAAPIHLQLLTKF